mmetsp:Transcript_27757/g.70069  ORF Transcript_27757/g.70069 Transcript_27757/m.70069 type:complete len:395 (+) Transcript_27757:162-1346(+)|eukprot:CAMPEP_0178993436 /NCGR_PEP_ID=MMETSP0795-20121207/6702_1 /TAXON_ID=88552 /ORGANISM="Amoebophrya sp., Strain Ameob2" /LENGTH=394 /DNA_ID=CAMNT_0020685495 /DNA_START=65 /DNA_END=1249 /DNA_ORIENTATION=-
MPSKTDPASGSDPYRALFLRQVEATLRKEPDIDSLVELLQIGTPEFTRAHAQDTEKRKRAEKELMLRLHPDKHGGDCKSTGLFQELKSFLNSSGKAAEGPAAKKRKKAASLPSEFDAETQWPFLIFFMIRKSDPESDPSPPLPTTTCAYVRAQIAHGRAFTLVGKNNSLPFSSWNQWPGRLKTLKGASAEEIMKEITKNGPVVSTSFTPTARLVSKYEIASGIAGEPAPVLLTGWHETDLGTAWKVKIRKCVKVKDLWVIDLVDAEIATGQFNIEQEISFVPQSALKDIEYAKDFDYVAIPGDGVKELQANSKLVIPDLDYASELLQKMLCVFSKSSAQEGRGLAAAFDKKRLVEVHAPGLRSASQRAALVDVMYDKKVKKWTVTLMKQSQELQ